MFGPIEFHGKSQQLCLARASSIRGGPYAVPQILRSFDTMSIRHSPDEVNRLMESAGGCFTSGDEIDLGSAALPSFVVFGIEIQIAIEIAVLATIRSRLFLNSVTSPAKFTQHYRDSI